MWWSRRSKIAASTDMKEVLAEAGPVSTEIHELLKSRGVSAWVGMMALSVCLGEVAAAATAAGPLKGYLRMAHRFVDTAFWAAYDLAKERTGV